MKELFKIMAYDDYGDSVLIIIFEKIMEGIFIKTQVEYNLPHIIAYNEYIPKNEIEDEIYRTLEKYIKQISELELDGRVLNGIDKKEIELEDPHDERRKAIIYVTKEIGEKAYNLVSIYAEKFECDDE